MRKDKPNPENPRQGALNPAAGDGVVVIKDPPNAEMQMTPDEADISGMRMLDAADQSRKPPHAPGAKPDPRPVSGQ